MKVCRAILTLFQIGFHLTSQGCDGAFLANQTSRCRGITMPKIGEGIEDNDEMIKITVQLEKLNNKKEAKRVIKT